MEAGFQFPRQPCNIYLIEKTLSLKSIVKPRSLNAHTAEGAIESVRINVVSVLMYELTTWTKQTARNDEVAVLSGLKRLNTLT